MKPICLTILSCFFAVTLVGQKDQSGRFLKRVEYNMITHRGYNFDSKTEIEKRLFGDFNADAEFYVEPSFDNAYGFRIVADTAQKSYVLEIKQTTDRLKVNLMLEDKYPGIGYSSAQLKSATKEELERSTEHNRRVYEKIKAEAPGLYNVESRSYPISDSLARAIYNKFKTAIDDYKGVGIPPGIVDGERVKFRTVVADEVWTLSIHSPRGEMRDLADLSRQLMDDLDSGNFDETKYLEKF